MFPINQPDQRPPPERLIRLRVVEARVGIKRSTIYRLIKAGQFPAPIKLGANVVAWRESAINAWVQQKISQSGQSSPA